MVGGVAAVLMARAVTVHRIAEAIAYVESRGRYDAVGPIVPRTGDRAYGRYQVMGANVRAWSLDIIGRTVEPAEFLASPALQDTIARTKFAELFARYGSVQDVASVWFSGRPLARAGNDADVTGTTVPVYVQKVMQAFTNPPAVNV